jgi:hypothetical protein
MNIEDWRCSRPCIQRFTINQPVSVLATVTNGEYSKDFWGTYGQFRGIFASNL